MGPSAIRVANLDARLAALGYQVHDYGNVTTEQAESVAPGHVSARYLHEIAATCKRLSTTVQKALTAGQLPLVLGGDHSVAIGTVSGVARHYRKQKKSIGLLWIDAHADMNTPESSPNTCCQEGRACGRKRCTPMGRSCRISGSKCETERCTC